MTDSDRLEFLLHEIIGLINRDRLDDLGERLEFAEDFESCREVIDAWMRETS